ncbi:TonB-dependent receptor domain-containing protein [Steroidobacter cummioxidans]|uniref:TonB-dependent receptor domain-containing protein n=1 Tax=Steroidobacter cummioxidans TaxID=1803913 RepID=UPI000E31094C|nr:TonB-dependent receptor [Steroidobacter cummioxidans]
MSTNISIRRAVKYALLTGFAAAAATSLPVVAAENQDMVAEVIVTGSRIQRLDYIANSPITTVSSDAITANTDVTLDTFMNTLPQVNPAGTTTSNNPSNGGQSNVNLRGLGANRNLVLIDGRRPMVSASDLTVDLNTIPQALVESIEVITGGAGAVYGADAVAGVVNIKTKTNFNGLDVRTGFSNHLANWDSREYNLSALLGSDFADDRGNAVIGFDFSQRDGLIKSQRPFSAIATSTTGAIPEGVVRNNGANSYDQAVVDQVFAGYGAAPGSVPIATSPVGFNMDGTLFGLGVFNRPQDVVNFKYPIDLSVNTRFYPDVYSYNFDAVNILTLPLKRRSFFGKFDYEIGGGVEAFAQVGYTSYNSTTGIAPTPMPTGNGTQSLTGTDPFSPTSALVTPGRLVSGSLVVPVTNPFIPADLRRLLDSRTGDDASLVGSGANEPFLMSQRTLPLGLRTNDYENEVVQYLLGFRGDLPFLKNWRWEAYASEGRTEIDQLQSGNVNAQRLQTLLEAPDGGNSICAGGYNPFGRQAISPQCQTYLEAITALKQEFQQRVIQAFVGGDTFELPAGPVGLVVGAEYRDFDYELDPGAAGGAIYGFNSQSRAGGSSTFKDAFAEVLIPLVSDAPFARRLELSLGYRYSESSFENMINPAQRGDGSNDAYKLELSWQPFDSLRGRASYQRAVRAPNFSELFDGSTSAPQYFDPCTFASGIRNSANAAAVRGLCTANGQATTPANGRVPVAAYDNFAPLPGGQITTTQGGNTALKPETADTMTFGLVFSSPWEGALSSLRGSIDYYNIKIADVILAPDPNIFIADCYNYFGNNPTYDFNYSTCQQIVRNSAGTIARVNGPNGIVFPGENGTKFNTDGIDVQVDYGMDMPSLFGQSSRLNLNMFVNYLLSFERQDRSNLPTLDYKGTVSYFGQGLGSSFPEFKVNLTANYMVGPVGLNVRARWIDSMQNRASVQFAGEPSFSGVPSVTYLDASLSWEFMDGGLARIGVNNLTDKEPPLYAPSVQSGTDPSLYDVVGRRIFGQLNFKF